MATPKKKTGRKKNTEKADTSRNPAAPPLQPRALKRISELKERLLRGDRTDHQEEVAEWEKQAKRALVKLDLKKHVGVQLLLKEIVEMIRDAESLLKRAKSSDLSDSERDGVIEKLDFMKWFVSFFVEAKEDLDAIEKELEYQLDGDEDDVDTA